MRDFTSTNFLFLEAHDAQLVRLAALAERYFADDPSTFLTKLRQYPGLLAKHVAAEHARSNYLLPKLGQAILAAAFRGELVPQDPNEDPATELLARVVKS